MSAPNQLSFLPDDYLERKARRRANILCGVLAVIVLGVIVTAFQYMEKITKAVDAKDSAVDQRYNDAARRIQKVNQMRAQQQQVVRRAELAASLGEKVPRSNILAELTHGLHPGGVHHRAAAGASADQPGDGVEGARQRRPAGDDRLRAEARRPRGP